MARLYINSYVRRWAQRAPLVDRGLRRLETSTVAALWAVTRMLRVERASAIGALFGGTIGPRLRKHRHVLGNLSIAFPEKDRAWIEATGKEVWRQIGRTLAEYPHIDLFHAHLDRASAGTPGMPGAAAPAAEGGAPGAPGPARSSVIAEARVGAHAGHRGDSRVGPHGSPHGHPHARGAITSRGTPRMALEAAFDLELLRNAERGFVLLAMHQGNWNLPGLCGALGGFPFDVIYGEQKHPDFEAMIAAHRNRMPCGFIHIDDTPRAMIQALKGGRSVGLFVDQRVDAGDPVPFFGHDAPTVTIPARIACRLGTGVIPTGIARLPGARFRLTMAEPIYADPAAGDAHRASIGMMARVHRQFEAWIRAQPADWCCVKRRWPKGTVPARSGADRSGAAS